MTLCKLGGYNPEADRWPGNEWNNETRAYAFEKAWHEALDAEPDVPQVPQLPDVPAPSLASAFPDDEPPF